jgi:outer membrane protein W
MKRTITALAIGLMATMGFNNTASAQVEQGNFMIDAYYGYPNLGKSFVDLFVSDNGISGTTLSAVGPCGVRAEYMLADNFGLGVDFIYNSAALSGTVDSLNADNTVFRTYDAKIYFRRYRVQLRANYHFVQTDQLDSYVGFGAGTNIRTLGITSDYPNFKDSSFTGAIIPVSVRLALGMRYFFTDNIGMNLELGIGGPIISGGLSIKI